MKRMLLIGALALLVVPAACGKKAAPLPPPGYENPVK